MKSLSSVLYSFFVLILKFVYSEEAYAGPFEIVVQKVVNCEDTGLRNVYVKDLELKRIAPDLYAAKGSVIFLRDLNETLGGTFIFSQLKGNARSQFMNYEYDNSCREFEKYLPDLYHNITQTLSQGRCFIPANEYVLSYNISLKWSSLQSSMPYGKYIITHELIVDHELIGCMVYYSDVVPRKVIKKKKKN